MAFKILTQPTVEPVSLDEAKLHLRLDDSGEDSLVSALITAARELVETKTGRAMINRYCSQTFESFGSGLQLQSFPVSAVSGVTYYDLSGTVTTFPASGYQAMLDMQPATLFAGVDADWPSTQAGRMLPITATFVAGHGASGTDVPEGMKTAIKLLVAHWYRNRESVSPGQMNEVPMAVDSLLWPFRVLGAES
jgi:uncharacterized phiE125 gp8 family phage protein